MFILQSMIRKLLEDDIIFFWHYLKCTEKHMIYSIYLYDRPRSSNNFRIIKGVLGDVIPFYDNGVFKPFYLRNYRGNRDANHQDSWVMLRCKNHPPAVFFFTPKNKWISPMHRGINLIVGCKTIWNISYVFLYISGNARKKLYQSCS